MLRLATASRRVRVSGGVPGRHPSSSKGTTAAAAACCAWDNAVPRRQHNPCHYQLLSTRPLSSLSWSRSFPQTPPPRLMHHHHLDGSRRTKVFVSRHNESLNVTADQILHLVSAEARTTTTHVMVKECPFCPKPTNQKASNQYKLYVQIGGGAYFCHRCGAKGSWFDFKAALGGFSADGSTLHVGGGPKPHKHPLPAVSAPVPPLPVPPPRLAAVYSSALLDVKKSSNSKDKDGADALTYLTDTRGLSVATLRKYGVGKANYKFPTDQGTYQDAECITFPWLLTGGQIAEQEALRGATTEKQLTEEDKAKWTTRRIKARAVQNKAWQRLDPPGGGWGLFGWHTVPSDATQVVVTEGEYDAMAVWQATGRPAVSVPNGCRSLPPQVLPLLESMDNIILWMDSDGPGQEGAQAFCQKLGHKRTRIVSCPDAKDANEALLKDLDLEKYIQAARVMPHENILTFADLREAVLHEMFNPDQYTGVPVLSLPDFTNKIKGFRRGEMTVLTGPTGSGKTTFLGQVSLDLAEQGITCLWGSFEIKNTRLMHKLLQQFGRGPLPKVKEEAFALADRFEDLPMYFMKFHGGSDIDDVLDAMEYAVYVNDVEHIILDNMQFMITRDVKNVNSKFDKFDVQDICIEKFRKFATHKNVHITLVVHPRKEDETAKLNISSFYGSAKATQEADTVLILQRDEASNRKWVEVKKNRFDGTLGFTPLHFHADSNRYVENEQGSPGKTPPPHSGGRGGGGGGHDVGSASRSTPPPAPAKSATPATSSTTSATSALATQAAKKATTSQTQIPMEFRKSKSTHFRKQTVSSFFKSRKPEYTDEQLINHMGLP